MVDLAQLVRVSGCGPEGRRFESGNPPQKPSRTAWFFYVVLTRKRSFEAIRNPFFIFKNFIIKKRLPWKAVVFALLLLPEFMTFRRFSHRRRRHKASADTAKALFQESRCAFYTHRRPIRPSPESHRNQHPPQNISTLCCRQASP